MTANAAAQTVAERMTPEQKQAALVRLCDLERGLPQPPPILKELGDAYLALGSSADAARVAARLQELEPKKPEGYRIAAHALYDSGDYEDAAAEALAALKRDPHDQRAVTVLKLARGRISSHGTDDEIDGSAVVVGDDAASALGQPTVEKHAKLNDLAEPPAFVAVAGAGEERSFPWLPAGAATTLAGLGAWLWGRKEDDAVPEPLIEKRFASGREQAEHYERTAELQELGRKASWVTLYGSIGLTAALAGYGTLTYFAGSLPSMGALVSTEGTVLGANGAAVLATAAESAAPVVAAGVGTVATKLAVDETADAFGGAQVSYAESENRIGRYRPPPKDRLQGFPDAKRAKKKSPVTRGGGKRARWKSDDGKIYEWDSRHGRVEVYDKRGRHIGEFDPDTGRQIKPANPTRRVEP